MQDDFSNFTSCPSSMTKCQLHQGACKMTFQISPCVHLAWPSVPSTTPKFSHTMTFQISPHIHLAWPSTPKFSREVDTRWLFECHLVSMRDDIWKVYKGKILQISIISPWDIAEVTSNSKVLTWGAHKMTFQISPCVHLVWQSTPKFSHGWTRDDFSNVTSRPCEMTFERYIRGKSCRPSSFGLGTLKR